MGASPSPQKKLSVEKVKDIEEIVKIRKKDRVYVPLSFSNEEQENVE
jgi:hypothetical protein